MRDNSHKKNRLFNKRKIHKWQMAYIVLSVSYLILLTSAFFIMLYGSNNIQFLASYLLLIVAAMSFISQFINITCNILNIINVRRELSEQSKKDNSALSDARKQIAVACGFIGESTGFLGIASILLILGSHLLPFSSIALPLRLFNIVASLFSVTYGSILLMKSIEGNARSKQCNSVRIRLHAMWSLLNSVIFVSLGIYNLLYETLLHEVLDFSANHDLAMLLKAALFIGYAVILTSIFLSQVFVPSHDPVANKSSNTLESETATLLGQEGCEELCATLLEVDPINVNRGELDNNRCC
ncbi:hypothetical protein [Ehrlichia chaffeensis]|uniref:hypothetical protein n=2 Tax=Ehrlichia chaffeensis TaxID=945 RepID=UPI000444E362|nr:hypothetical protein [Ehrlichia chaffeensis]AHX05521.1 putative membrane protein [Ehrlichia chaffeensis str. Jax]AHX07650.1 putative membrane protein [Ehrlichia chaffeensis str. Osceola]